MPNHIRYKNKISRKKKRNSKIHMKNLVKFDQEFFLSA